MERYYQARFRWAISKKTINLVFANTIVNGNLVEKLLSTIGKTNVITYVHELSYAISLQQLFVGDIAKVINHTSLFLAGSNAVSAHLQRMGVVSTAIKVAHSSIPVVDFLKKSKLLQQDEIRQQLGIPTDTHMIVAVGAASWRKGSDWFMQLAAQLSGTGKPIALFWVGATPGTMEYIHLDYELQRYKLDGFVKLVPITSEYFKYIYAADLFVLTSREDPFPLVVLEAALVGKPIVCFADSGGTPEFVGTENGIVVPYGHVGAMAQAIIELLAKPQELKAKGAHGRAEVIKHHDVPLVAAQIVKQIDQLVS